MYLLFFFARLSFRYYFRRSSLILLNWLGGCKIIIYQKPTGDILMHTSEVLARRKPTQQNQMVMVMYFTGSVGLAISLRPKAKRCLPKREFLLSSKVVG